MNTFNSLLLSSTPVKNVKPTIKGVFLSVQFRRWLRKFKNKYFSSHDLSCLTSIDNIFKSSSDAAHFRHTQFELRAVAGLKLDIFVFTKNDTLNNLIAPRQSLTFESVDHLPNVIANLFNNFLVSSMITDSYFPSVHFTNRNSVPTRYGQHRVYSYASVLLTLE